MPSNPPDPFFEEEEEGVRTFFQSEEVSSTLGRGWKEQEFIWNHIRARRGRGAGTIAALL